MSNGTIDWTDPCAAAAIIREKYYSLVAGGGVAEIQFADRRVRYNQTTAADMLALLNRLEAECALKTGTAPRRFAISLGGKRGVLPDAGSI